MRNRITFLVLFFILSIDAGAGVYTSGYVINPTTGVITINNTVTDDISVGVQQHDISPYTQTIGNSYDLAPIGNVTVTGNSVGIEYTNINGSRIINYSISAVAPDIYFIQARFNLTNAIGWNNEYIYIMYHYHNATNEINATHHYYGETVWKYSTVTSQRFFFANKNPTVFFANRSNNNQSMILATTINNSKNTPEGWIVADHQGNPTRVWSRIETAIVRNAINLTSDTNYNDSIITIKIYLTYGYNPEQTLKDYFTSLHAVPTLPDTVTFNGNKNSHTLNGTPTNTIIITGSPTSNESYLLSYVSSAKSEGYTVLGYFDPVEVINSTYGNWRNNTDWYNNNTNNFTYLNAIGTNAVGTAYKTAGWGNQSYYVNPRHPNVTSKISSELDYLYDTIGIDGLFVDATYVNNNNGAITNAYSKQSWTEDVEYLWNYTKTYARSKDSNTILIANSGYSFYPNASYEFDGFIIEVTNFDNINYSRLLNISNLFNMTNTPKKIYIYFQNPIGTSTTPWTTQPRIYSNNNFSIAYDITSTNDQYKLYRAIHQGYKYNLTSDATTNNSEISIDRYGNLSHLYYLAFTGNISNQTGDLTVNLSGLGGNRIYTINVTDETRSINIPNIPFYINQTIISYNHTINATKNASVYNATITEYNATIVPSATIYVTVNTYNSTLFNFTATGSGTMNITMNNSDFVVTNGALYSIKKDGVTQQSAYASGNSVSFTNIAVGSDYEIALGGISSITIPANSWGMFNNWSANLTFSQIAANESNDVAYTWYNTTSGDWEDLYVGQTFNQNNIIPYWNSVLGYFNAQTTITATVVTPSDTGLTAGWNMLYVEGGTNRTLSEIQTNLALSCTVNDLYKWNTTTADYDNTGTSVVQPNEGFIVDVAGNCNWIRTTI